MITQARYIIQIRRAEPNRSRFNDGWDDVADVIGTEDQAISAVADYRTRRTIAAVARERPNLDDEFRYILHQIYKETP